MPKNPHALRKAQSVFSTLLQTLNNSLPNISPYAKNMSSPGFKLFIQGHTILIEKPTRRPQTKS